MKSVTKSYTNSTNNSINVNAGLTDAQTAGVYAINITYNVGSNKYYAGTFFANTTSGGYTTFGNSGSVTIQFGNSGSSTAVTAMVQLVSTVTACTLTFYYFE